MSDEQTGLEAAEPPVSAGEPTAASQTARVWFEECRRAEAQVKRLLGAIHSAVSWTYIDGEAARLRTRVELKAAAGWPLSDGEEERLQELASADAASGRPESSPAPSGASVPSDAS